VNSFDVKLFNMTPASLRKKLALMKQLTSGEDAKPSEQIIKMCETLLNGLPRVGVLISIDVRSIRETTSWYVTMSWQTLDIPTNEQSRYEW